MTSEQNYLRGLTTAAPLKHICLSVLATKMLGISAVSRPRLR